VSASAATRILSVALPLQSLIVSTFLGLRY
jgi:hypothetical protein